jgi:hypothetical protein
MPDCRGVAARDGPVFRVPLAFGRPSPERRLRY